MSNSIGTGSSSPSFTGVEKIAVSALELASVAIHELSSQSTTSAPVDVVTPTNSGSSSSSSGLSGLMTALTQLAEEMEESLAKENDADTDTDSDTDTDADDSSAELSEMETMLGQEMLKEGLKSGNLNEALEGLKLMESASQGSSSSSSSSANPLVDLLSKLVSALETPASTGTGTSSGTTTSSSSASSSSSLPQLEKLELGIASEALHILGKLEAGNSSGKSTS